MWCEICQQDISVGVGGEGNFRSHQMSKRHKEIVSATKSNQTIRSFFSKAPTPSQVAIGSGTSLSTLLVQAATLSHPTTAPSDPPQHPAVAQPSLPPKSALLAKLEVAISTLPDNIPIGTEEDAIAQFSGDPGNGLEDEEDAWEMIDKALNRVIGYGTTATEIENLIRRGCYGMDGMLSWLKECVYTLKIDEALLENKVERLISAMLKLCVHLMLYCCSR